MKKILFVQFSNSMYLRHEVCDGYWDAFYDKYNNIGYWRGEHWFEVPKWIAEVDYMLNKDVFEREVFYCEHDIKEVINKIITSKPDYTMFSLMDCNKFFIEDIVKQLPNYAFIVGGYNEEFLDKLFVNYPNVCVVNTMEDDAIALGVEYKHGTDYSLFKGATVLPRLTMSYGCKNNCKFCIVPHGDVVPVDSDIIKQQALSFKDLKFKLVYIDDKTFGQCLNHILLQYLYKLIKDYNPDFEGFVVQTTTKMLIDNYDMFKYIGVKVAEVGFETMNDEILSAYRKPSSEKLIEQCVKLCNKKKDIKLILNVIIGLEEETETTYEKTLNYLKSNINNTVIGMNPAIYTDYSLGDDCLGEIDFQVTPNIELHKKYWEKFNTEITKILKKGSSFNTVNDYDSIEFMNVKKGKECIEDRVIFNYIKNTLIAYGVIKKENAEKELTFMLKDAININGEYGVICRENGEVLFNSIGTLSGFSFKIAKNGEYKLISIA